MTHLAVGTFQNVGVGAVGFVVSSAFGAGVAFGRKILHSWMAGPNFTSWGTTLAFNPILTL